MMMHRPAQRPSTGGTHNGTRPHWFTYWRVGYGDAEGLALDFWVEQAGEYHCTPPHHYPMQDFQIDRWTRVYYIMKGNGRWHNNSQQVNLHPGDIFILPPNHPGTHSAKETHEYHFFGLAGSWPSLWGDTAQIMKFSIGIDMELSNHFTSLRESLILGQTGYALKALSDFYAICARVRTLSTPTEMASPYPDAVRNALIYLEENCTRPFHAQKTADSAHISAPHLRTLFEKHVGHSPKRYHTQCRINLAKKLLAQQSLSMQSIAQTIGFSDSGHFSRVFKQFTGMSPSQYAKQL